MHIHSIVRYFLPTEIMVADTVTNVETNGVHCPVRLKAVGHTSGL